MNEAKFQFLCSTYGFAPNKALRDLLEKALEFERESAARWRNEAYRLGGTPLPWSPDEKLLKRALDALNAYNTFGIITNAELLREALSERLQEKDE